MVEMINTIINGDWPIILPKHRADRPEWYTEKGWERERLDSMFTHLVELWDWHKKNPLVYYVGAEEGDLAGLLAVWGCDVALFEPNDKVWPNIKAIWEANNLEQPVFCFSGFASNQTRDMAMGMAYNRFPLSADGPVIGDHGFMELPNHNAPEVTLDDIVGYQGIPIPDAISIDVEGSEWQVLRGAEKLLIEHHPQIWLSIHPEFMFRFYGEYQQDLRNWLKDRGYKEELLAYDHEVHLRYYV